MERCTVSEGDGDVMASGRLSLVTIAGEFNQRGTVTRRAGAWRPATVRDILNRPRTS